MTDRRSGLCIVIDAVVFQRGDPVWRSRWTTVLAHLTAAARAELILLDRGGSPLLEGLLSVPCPAHLGSHEADDSAVLQLLCDRYRADVFVSTGATTPLTTPMVLWLDSAHAYAESDPQGRAGTERDLAVAFAERYVCEARSDADAAARYPALPPDRLLRVSIAGEHHPEHLVGSLLDQCERLASESSAPASRSFRAEWCRLRTTQAQVDTLSRPMGTE